MTQEEKAKEFDASLERAKKLIETCDSTAVIGWCEYIFPMLKEPKAEDEKIRKALIDTINSWGVAMESPYMLGVSKKDCLAWLEKQGNQPNKVSIWKHWKDGIAGNGNGEPIYLIKDCNTYSLSSCLGFECDYIELSELDNLMFEKQGEQNLTWSEEDEDMLDNIIDDYDDADEHNLSDDIGKVMWLKSLKQRMNK